MEVLFDFQVSIPESAPSGPDSADGRNTSNAVRDLGDALRRRCVYLYLDFPHEQGGQHPHEEGPRIQPAWPCR